MAFDFQEFMSQKIRKEFEIASTEICCGHKEPAAEYVAMRDGTRLHTWMIFPKEEKAQYPVILTRTCYPNNDFIYRIYGEELAMRGYVFIWQYTRGREESEGEWVPNIHERDDGIDTVDWIVSQSWCECLGYWGMSYTSMTGWAMADAVDGKVTSMYLEHYGTDRFVSAYEKGSFRQDVLTSWSMENGPVKTDCSYDRYLESCRYMPQSHVDEALWGGRNDSYRSYISSPEADAELWQSGWWKTLREIPEKTTLPLCLVSGWYDHHHGSSMKTWERLSDTCKAHSQLVIGAWNHFMQPVIPGRETQNMNPEEIPPMFKWFELTLKQKKEPEQKVCCYVIGEDKWMESKSWPIMNESSMWYLEAGQIGNKYAGKLIHTEQGNENTGKSAEVTYTYDPQKPVISVGGEGLLKTMQQVGSLAQPEAGYRPDVLSFLSDPLECDLKITGQIRVELYVRSDCEDTAFTAKLIEVMPDGTAYHIRSSITTIDQDQPKGEKYTPGKVTKVELSMWDIVYTIKTGHRLRLDISSSDFPQFNLHCNYAGLWSTQTECRPAQQTILTGGEYASRIMINFESGH